MNFILGDQVSGQICELDAKFDYAGMDTSNLEVNALFSVKRSFTRNTKDSKKEIPTENGGESYLVDKVIEISNLDLLKDMTKIIEIMRFTGF